MSAGGTGGGISRRQFLVGCGTVGAATVGTPLARAADQRESTDSSRLPSLQPFREASRRISSEGQQALAAVDRRFQQQRPTMQKTVHAVKDLGLDPTGKESINGKFGSALSGMSNTRVVFPADGTFALSGQITATPEGPIELVGNGCSFVIPAGKEMKSLTLVLPGGSLVRDIVIDQSAKGALQEFSVQSNGVVRADNVTIKGYAPATKRSDSDSGGVDSMFSPIARTSEATVRATNFTAIGGTAAGTHDEADKPPDSLENTLGSPMGIWVGSSNEGTVQLANPQLRGWSNGIYGGRTKGKVEIRGGTFANNFNAQIRIGGGSVVDGTSILLDDRKWSKKAHPGPFKIGHQGVLAGRVDAKHGNLTDPATFKNLRVVANSMRHVPALFRWNHEAGPGIIRNCHITNHIDAPIVYGRSPAVPAATNILVDQSLIDGKSSASVMEIHDRPQSRIQRTCIQLPGTGPNDINGAQVGKAVSFGKQCEAGSGLKNPEKVGDGGNLSTLPAPVTNGSYPGQNPGSSKQENFFKIVTSGFMVMVFVLVGMIAVLVGGIVAAAGSLAALLGGSDE